MIQISHACPPFSEYLSPLWAKRSQPWTDCSVFCALRLRESIQKSSPVSGSHAELGVWVSQIWNGEKRKREDFYFVFKIIITETQSYKYVALQKLWCLTGFGLKTNLLWSSKSDLFLWGDFCFVLMKESLELINHGRWMWLQCAGCCNRVFKNKQTNNKQDLHVF